MVAPESVHHSAMKKARYLVMLIALALPGYAIASHYFGSHDCPSCPQCP